MCQNIIEPPTIKEIFDKPGIGWSSEETDLVRDWLFQIEPLPDSERKESLQDSEKDRHWESYNVRMRCLLKLALWRNLGEGATPQDAEDALQSFCSPKEKRPPKKEDAEDTNAAKEEPPLKKTEDTNSADSSAHLGRPSSLDGVIKSYDPKKDDAVRFWEYLKFCFKRYCWQEAIRLGRRLQIEIPLEDYE